MSYTISDQGSGYQLTRLIENERDWYFAERSLWRIGLVETSGSTFYGWWDASTFATPVLTDNGTTCTISWTNAQNSVVTVSGLRVSTHLSLALSLSITLAGTDATTYAINRVEFPRFSIKPYETYYKDLQHVALPSIDGLVKQDICNAASLLEMDTANLSFIEPDSTSVPKNIGSAQFTYTYHAGADAGLLIRTNDTKLRFKRWTWAGDGNNANFTLTHCPANNLAATSYTTPFQVEVLPQPGGDWYDGCTRYRDLVEEDDPPWLSRGKQYQRERDTFEERAGMLVAIVSVGYSSSWMGAQANALKLLLPWDCKLGLHTQDGNGENWPDYKYRGTTVSLATDYDLPTWFYMLTHYTDSTSPFYADGEWVSYMLQDPSELVVLDPDQSVVTSGDNVYFNMVHPQTRAMLGEAISQLTTNNDNEGTKQFYFDAGMHAGIQDFRTSLTDAQTGTGSASFQDARHFFYRSTEGAHISEHCQEFYGDVISGMSMFGLFASLTEGDHVTGAHRVGMYPTVYSEYQTFWSPLVDGTVLTDDDTQYWIAKGALHQLYIRFMLGMIPSMLLPPSPYSMHTGTNQAKITSAYVDLVTTRHYFGHYFRGKRLRPPAGCREREIEEDGMTYTIVGSGLYITPSGGGETAVHCSIWQSHETPGAPLGIFLANESTVDKTFTLTMDRKDYPELDENEYLVTTSLADGKRTLVKQSLHGFSETITVPAESLVIMEAVSRYDCPGTLQLSNGVGALLLEDGTPMLKTWPQYLAQASGDPEELILLSGER